MAAATAVETSYHAARTGNRTYLARSGEVREAIGQEPRRDAVEYGRVRTGDELFRGDRSVNVGPVLEKQKL